MLEDASAYKAEEGATGQAMEGLGVGVHFCCRIQDLKWERKRVLPHLGINKPTGRQHCLERLSKCESLPLGLH